MLISLFWKNKNTFFVPNFGKFVWIYFLHKVFPVIYAPEFWFIRTSTLGGLLLDPVQVVGDPDVTDHESIN